MDYNQSDSSALQVQGFQQDIVDVDFEFYDPKESDFHGVKALLRSYLDGVAWELTAFVELILAQTTVGTVIKTGEDESPIGLITALNLERYKAHRCMQQIKTFILENCRDAPEIDELRTLWQKPKTIGLIVSERLVNVPLDLAPPLYEGLFQEIAWATEDEPSQTLQDAFKFMEYLILTRVYQEVSIKEDSAKLKKNKKRKKKLRSLAEGAADLVYINAEDEIFHELSSWSCTFPVHAETLAASQTRGLKLLRLVMCIKADRVQDFRSSLSSFVE